MKVIKDTLKKIKILVKIKWKIQYCFFPPEFPSIGDIIRKNNLKIHTIIHVGAHEGQEINDYMSLEPEMIVFIEADPQTFKKLKNNSKDWKLENKYKLINALIDSTSGTEKCFYRYTHSQSSSLFLGTDIQKKTWTGLEPTNEVLKLKTSTLREIIIENNLQLSENSILILDIQGSELNALIGLGNYLYKFMYIEVEASEVEIYKGAPLLSDINNFMVKNGFKLITKAQWHGDIVYENLKLK